jgi:hypothetical protein
VIFGDFLVFFGVFLVMRSTEDLGDFWGIFLNGFHGGRKGKISPTLKKFPVRKKKIEEEENLFFFFFFFSKNIKRLATWVNSTRLKYPIFRFFLKITK